MSKTVLVSGASGDIGYKICSLLLENNYRVIGLYNNSKKKIDELTEAFPNAFVSYKIDLSDFNNSSLLIELLEKDSLTIDILINNAGISYVGLLQDLPCSQWNKIWNTNVTSAVALSKNVIPHFLKSGQGKIINISSVWGSHGASCEVAYSTTKGAINTFTKALALELAPSNIQVNALACGFLDTKMNGHLSEDEIQEIIEDIPARRLGTPLDVAQAVLSLCQQGDYLTGQVITLDGGWI